MDGLARAGPGELLGLLQEETSRSLEDQEAWDSHRLSVQMGTDCCLLKANTSERFPEGGLPQTQTICKRFWTNPNSCGDPTALGGAKQSSCLQLWVRGNRRICAAQGLELGSRQIPSSAALPCCPRPQTAVLHKDLLQTLALFASSICRTHHVSPSGAARPGEPEQLIGSQTSF